MTWKQIIDSVRELTKQFHSEGSIAWFQGHSDSNYELKSRLHRYLELLTRDFKAPPATNEWKQLLRDEYKTLYRRFKADAWPLLDPRERSDWGIIFAMCGASVINWWSDWCKDLGNNRLQPNLASPILVCSRIESKRFQEGVEDRSPTVDCGSTQRTRKPGNLLRLWLGGRTPSAVMF